MGAKIGKMQMADAVVGDFVGENHRSVMAGGGQLRMCCTITWLIELAMLNIMMMNILINATGSYSPDAVQQPKLQSFCCSIPYLVVSCIAPNNCLSAVVGA